MAEIESMSKSNSSGNILLSPSSSSKSKRSAERKVDIFEEFGLAAKPAFDKPERQPTTTLLADDDALSDEGEGWDDDLSDIS